MKRPILNCARWPAQSWLVFLLLTLRVQAAEQKFLPPSLTTGREGASEHWAFKRAALSEPPKVKSGEWMRNPIDAFLLARLEKEKIAPSPEADRATLIRRLSLDLLGLPPAVSQVEDFVTDKRPDAYERLVDSFLGSPHFGERWGRHWLDLARYADSDGYEKDLPRPTAWLFRDWVIKAINQDTPFDQFTIEQLAGDLLPNATEDQKLATAFHRQTLTNREGGVDKEEFRCKATVDRVATTGAVWLGLTMACAECHTHKYDPITQREFYQFYAFFNNASEKEVPAPQPAELAEYQKQIEGWQEKLAELEKPLQTYRHNVLDPKLADWEKTIKLPTVRWSVLVPGKVAVAVEGDETLLTAEKDHSISPRSKDGVRSRFTVEAEVDLKGVTGFRIEAIDDPGKTVGRGDKGDFALSEFTVAAQTGEGKSRTIELVSARADFAATNAEAAKAIDGNRDTGWSVTPQTNQTHVIVFEAKGTLDFPRGTKLIFHLEQFTVGLMNRFRISASSSPQPLEPSLLPDAVLAALDTPPTGRTAPQQEDLGRYFAEQVDPEGMKLNEQITAHKAQRPKFPGTLAAILVSDERKTHVHIRGDFLRKGDEVQPAGLRVLHPLKARGPNPDRLDLAHWLLDPDNPLTARVTVNHVWKTLFGRGLVTTVDDFGTRGEKPSHPELLDWLAITFRTPRTAPGALGPPNRSRSAVVSESGLGWSRKALIRLIVTSSAYRQSSQIRPDLVARDPNNVLLARQNRLRLEAENVRDVYLAASGLLNPAIGGPSIHPPLPADIAALGYAGSIKWPESKGADQYRRGLYIFFQRTVPYPMLVTFDAPDSNGTCARRERSNTPLQALTLLNDPVFFECAQLLGQRLAQEPIATPEKIRRAFQICLSREPSAAELDRLTRLYSEQMSLLKSQSEQAGKIAGAKTAESSNLEETATLVALSRIIMNLDEFVTRD